MILEGLAKRIIDMMSKSRAYTVDPITDADKQSKRDKLSKMIDDIHQQKIQIQQQKPRTMPIRAGRARNYPA